MKRILSIIIVLYAINSSIVFPQCNGIPVYWQNPSFEGTPGPHITPPSWDICEPGTTPDTQPGFWGVTLPPSNGSTYIGLINALWYPGVWHEGVSQQLSSPLVAGVTYTFTIDVATVSCNGAGCNNWGIIPCGELQVWGNMGGNGGCDTTSLLWSTGVLTNHTWNTFTVTFTPAQNWTNLLFMSHNMGCTNGVYIVMDNLTQVIPYSDIPEFTWNGLCLGTPFQFSDMSSTNDSIISWSWDFGDGTANSMNQNPVHTYTTSGTYDVTLTITNTIPCTTSSTHTVTVNPLPSVNVMPGNTSICFGDTVNLTASGADAYIWAPATGLSASTGSNIQASPSVNTTYTLTGTDTLGCSASTSFTIDVFTLPIATAGNNGPLCAGENLFLTSSGGTSYNWSGPNGFTSILQNPIINNANTSGLGIYTVTASVAAGCSATAQTNVIISNNPSVNIINIINETCTSGNGSAIADVTGGAQPYTYQWNSSPVQQNNILNNLHAGVYILTVTDINSCSDTVSFTITDTPAPTISITSIPANCGFSNGSMTASANGGAPPYQFLWNTYPAQSSQTITGTGAGIYSVSVTDNNGCIVQITDTLSALSGPDAAVVMTNETCNRHNGEATAIVNGGTGSYTYLWDSNPAQYTQTVSGLSAGIYTLFVSDGGCSDTVKFTINNSLGPIADFNINPKIISLYDDIAVSFIDESSGSITQWTWTLGDNSTSNLNNFVHYYNTGIAGTYIVSLTVTDTNLCTDTKTDSVIVKDIYTFYIPNAFSPNDDGVNDFFNPMGVNWDVNNFEMYIFNRWGELVFYTENINNRWNGSVNNAGNTDNTMLGVYVYLIKVKEKNGPDRKYVGTVSLIK